MTITTAQHCCIGDSITAGLGDPNGNGFRRELLSLVKSARPSFTMNFVGPLSSGDSPTNLNFGVVGDSAGELNAAAPTFLGPGKIQATTATVLIGTNNARSSADAALFPTDYPALMATLHSLMPACGFLVYFIPPANARQTLIDVLNAELPAMWDTLDASGYIIERVTPRLFGPADYNPAETPSYVHPSPVGYPKIAQASLAAYLRLIARL